MAPVNPVIVVPGITATYLRDEYPVPHEIIWAVIRKDYERAALHPDNPRYEAAEPARVQPDQIYEIAYKELISELRFNLREREDQAVPVFAFGYDWRQPLEIVEQQLALFIDEVIERTKLLKHYLKTPFADEPKVSLVGHSMGGLIIAGYLERAGAKAKVGKVVTLATPFQGSFESVIKVITGTANLGTAAPSSREREAARITPSLYHLLPSFSGCLEVAGDEIPASSLFAPELWQPSVTDTIAEFIRLHGLNPVGRKEQAQSLFAGFLKQSEDHRKRVDRLKLADAGLTAKDWLCVVGVNAVTRVRLKIFFNRGQPDFEFRSTDRDDKWTSADEGERPFTGDGTVPFKGAVPLFLKQEQLVCVSPSDYGYWELQDRALTRLAGFHGIVPNMNMIHRLIVRHLTGRADKHKNTWGRSAPGVKRTDWDPPLPLELETNP
jgi:pimeloyl-ACP methyl ester carboxylesterase